MPHRLDADMLDSDGDPGAGTEVTVDIEGVWTGGTLDAYSDDEGHAEFETATGYEDQDRQLAARLFGVCGV
jgi:hypothetical protein